MSSHLGVTSNVLGIQFVLCKGNPTYQQTDNNKT